MLGDKPMIRVVLTMNLVALFSIAAVNYAAPQLDCPGSVSTYVESDEGPTCMNKLEAIVPLMWVWDESLT